MSDYTKSTNFATKDNLSSGNALKIVKGTEIDTEFNSIATAIATKADLTSPTFTGTPSLPTGTTGVTQTATNSSTLLATTAFVQAALQLLYPVGMIYTSTSSTNPGTSLGFGTWVAFGAGRVLMGAGGSYAAGSTGGSADAIIPSHTHTFSATSGATDLSHTHTIGGSANGQGGGATSAQCLLSDYSSYNNKTSSGASVSMNHTHSISGTTASTGVSPTDANLQPYVVVYIWNRTA